MWPPLVPSISTLERRVRNVATSSTAGCKDAGLVHYESQREGNGRWTTSSRLKSEAIGALPLHYRFVVVQWTKTTQMSFDTLLYIDILIFTVLWVVLCLSSFSLSILRVYTGQSSWTVCEKTSGMLVDCSKGWAQNWMQAQCVYHCVKCLTLWKNPSPSQYLNYSVNW